MTFCSRASSRLFRTVLRTSINLSQRWRLGLSVRSGLRPAPPGKENRPDERLRSAWEVAGMSPNLLTRKGQQRRQQTHQGKVQAVNGSLTASPGPGSRRRCVSRSLDRRNRRHSGRERRRRTPRDIRSGTNIFVRSCGISGRDPLPSPTSIDRFRPFPRRRPFGRAGSKSWRLPSV